MLWDWFPNWIYQRINLQINCSSMEKIQVDRPQSYSSSHTKIWRPKIALVYDLIIYNFTQYFVQVFNANNFLAHFTTDFNNLLASNILLNTTSSPVKWCSAIFKGKCRLLICNWIQVVTFYVIYCRFTQILSK